MRLFDLILDDLPDCVNFDCEIPWELLETEEREECPYYFDEKCLKGEENG